MKKLIRQTYVLTSLLILMVNTLMDISAGRGEYQVIDPAGTVVLSGKLQAGDTLNETLPLIGIKGSWTFYIFIEDAVGKYHFTISVK